MGITDSMRSMRRRWNHSWGEVHGRGFREETGAVMNVELSCAREDEIAEMF